MSISLKFYSDAGLTTLASLALTRQLADGGSDPVDVLFYLGSTEAGQKFRADSNPGVDPVLLSIDYNISTWTASTPKVAGDFVIPTTPDGYKYEIQTPGTSGVTEPVWDTTEGNTTNDGTIVWINRGPVHTPSECKLATTLAGLDTAVAGDPLNLGTQLLSEVANAQAIYMRIDQDTHPVQNDTDLIFKFPTLIEEAV